MRVANLFRRLGMSVPIGRAFVICAAAFGVSASWLGGCTLARCAEAARSEQAANRDLAAVAEMNGRDIAPAEVAVTSADLGGAGEFQSFVEDEASRMNCLVSEFQASPESQPFLSRFDKDTVSGPWMQTQVMFSVEGRLPDVYETVASVSRQTVAFEPIAVEFTRQTRSETGSVNVVARVQGYVVQRGGGAK